MSDVLLMCPDWCEVEHDADRPEDVSTGHERHFLHTSEVEVSALIEDRHQGDGLERLVWCSVDGEPILTPEQAREYATAILQAADLAEGDRK